MFRFFTALGLAAGLLSSFTSPALASLAGSRTTHVEPSTCSLEAGVLQLRSALRHGSPAYQRYARTWLKEAARSLPIHELQALFESEKDPEVIEALSAALAARVAQSGEHAAIKPVLMRAASEPEPAARAAAIRGLRGISSVETMAKLSPLEYADLIQDPAPEVQAAVADNLLAESAEVFFGHDRAVAEQSVEAALVAPDPQIAARLLRETSMEQIGPTTAKRLLGRLGEAEPAMQAGLVAALGGVPAHSAEDSEDALVALYKEVADPDVRKSVLAALVHLKLGAARPLLESLRGVDPTLSAEIDAWIVALGLGLQEWSLIRREKQRLSR